MHYPEELIIPFVLLILLMVTYVGLKCYSCSCFTSIRIRRFFNDKREDNWLILDADNSFNNSGNSSRNLSTPGVINLGCCFCVVTNRYRTPSLVYVQNADKVEYGTVNPAKEPVKAASGGILNKNGGMRAASGVNAACASYTMNDMCPICFERFNDKQKIVQLQCHHAYHSSCIAKWFNASSKSPYQYQQSISSSGSCPLCKDPVDTRILCTETGNNQHNEDIFYQSIYLHGMSVGVRV